MQHRFSIIAHAIASISVIASCCSVDSLIAADVTDGPTRLPPIQPVVFQQPLSDAESLPSLKQPELLPPDNKSEKALSLEDLEAMALASNPTLARAEADIQALRGKWLQSGLYPNTVRGYSGYELGYAGTAVNTGAFGQQ